MTTDKTSQVVLAGDCREVMATMDENSVDAIVTDPPYGLEFMGKDWDAPWKDTAGGFSSPGIGTRKSDWPSYKGSNRVRCGICSKLIGQGGSPCVCDKPVPVSTDSSRMQAFQSWCETWAIEALRIAKPGAYIAAFGGTRTYHRLTAALEDAGWEIRDSIMWIYGSGFPKSKNGEWGGTALKPAHEPIILARKPLIGTVAANFAAHGTGGLSIDACRVGWPDGVAPEIGTPGWGGPAKTLSAAPGVTGATVERNPPSQLGRWPANVIHDGSDEVISAFPSAPGPIANARLEGDCKTRGIYGAMRYGRSGEASAESDNDGTVGFKMRPGARRLDSGSAARFFYAAKASTKDREAGLGDFELRPAGIVSNTSGQHMTRREEGYERPKRANTHPTVKPTELMRYLCRLLTPQGGTILDPFCGSGSTGRGAALEGFDFVGIELCDGTDDRPDYISIARARIADAVRQASAVTQPDIFKESA